jgi:hypothetical protein
MIKNFAQLLLFGAKVNKKNFYSKRKEKKKVVGIVKNAIPTTDVLRNSETVI